MLDGETHMFHRMMIALLLTGCSADEGPSVGTPFPVLSWEGYVNERADGVSTTQPFVGYDSAAMRASGRGYALVHLSESF